MNANLLVVSADDFPNMLSQQLVRSGFSCFYSRGVLKTREILEKQQVDAIVWLFMGHERALAKDLLSVFNLFVKIPIVFITQSYEELDFAEDIRALFANLDLDDDLGDIIRTVETACNQSIIKEQEPVADKTNEIAFKNAVSQILGGSDKPVETDERQNHLQKVELWEAVDKSEKEILAQGIRIAEEVNTKKSSRFPKFSQFLKKR